MAFNNYNNQNNKTDYSPTVYSPYRMNNGSSTVDPTCITFSMWNSTLKISICPRKNNGVGNDEMQFDMENGISIYLSHTKARMFHEIIKKFRTDPVTYNESGVPSGSGFITISNGESFGTTNPCIVIRNIDQSGVTQTEYVYEMKCKDFYYGIYNFNSKDGSYNTNYEDFSNIELDQLEAMLEQYYTAMTMATAFTVVNQQRFENNRVSSKLNSICDKLGIETARSGNKFKNQSYFSGNNESSNRNQGFHTASLEDLDEEDV